MSVNSAQEAIDIGMSFIKKSYPYALPIKAIKKDDYWYVDIDVGIFQKRIANLKIASSTGEIIEFSVSD